MKGIIVSGSAKTKREIVPCGTMVGRCYSMIEIGTVEWEWKGEKKFTKKVRLSFELPNEIRDFGGEEKPMVIDKEYTMSLYEKANLRQDLESWRGAAFSKEDINSFDITNLLGQPAMLSIIHKTAGSGNEYAQIANISSLPKGMEVADQINESFVFNYTDKFDEEWLDVQPQWIQDQIKGTEDYQNKMNQQKFADTPTDDMPF
tara:strand:- start:3617 stop:4225 length:609 start_codon:yes stop_codon:yes gene_type:complete